jgi:dolichyl-phosphate-mannose-protein mannosyltransferase
MNNSTFLTFTKKHIAEHPTSWSLLLLMLAGLATRILWIQHPGSAVFDEVHFNYFASFYYSGLYYYDIHPPLGKLLLALSAYPAGGISAEEVVRTISTDYPSSMYIAMRLLPAIFGACLPVLVFLIARELKFHFYGALLAGVLVLFDNAILLQSRLIALDTILLFFGFSSIWLYLLGRRTENIKLLAAAGIAAGCSLSVKWIGVSFLGLIGLTVIYDWIREMIAKGFTIKPALIGTMIVVLTTSTYVATFFVHFALLPNSHKQGDQFMSRAFQSTLMGSRYYGAAGTITSVKCPANYTHKLKTGLPDTKVTAAENFICKISYASFTKPNFLHKFFELNRVMYTTNQGLGQGHPNSSPWYSWPVMYKPLYYWYNDGARIYLLGNPVVWWLSGLSVLILGLVGATKPKWREEEAFWFLQAGYWSNMLPFMLVERVMFMYHYLTSLCFAILLMSYLISRLPKAKYISISICGASIVGFLLISPLTYGANWFFSNMLWLLKGMGWHP